MDPFYVSVDGGGSSTTFLVADGQGNQLASCVVGSTSIKSIGSPQATANFSQGVKTLTDLGYPPSDAQAGVWGLSGCDSPEDFQTYQNILSDLGLSSDTHHICNDSLLALHAVCQPPAAVLISGTGSIAYAVDSRGATKRVGGLGYLFSDLGSGCWIGARLLEAFALHLEGVGAATSTIDSSDGLPSAASDPAFALIAAYLAQTLHLDEASLTKDPTLLAHAETPSILAGLAYQALTWENADASPLCTRVAEAAAEHLSAYVATLVNWLATREATADAPGTSTTCASVSGAQDASPTVVIAGGIATAPALNGPLAARVATQTGLDAAHIITLDTDPAWGGIHMARERRFYDQI